MACGCGVAVTSSATARSRYGVPGMLRSEADALKQQQPTLYPSLPGDCTSRAFRGLDLFLRFAMELELMHAAILG
jgi:hypothetical protein